MKHFHTLRDALRHELPEVQLGLSARLRHERLVEMGKPGLFAESVTAVDRPVGVEREIS